MKREQTTVRLPAELKEQLQREAQELGLPLNQLLTQILRSELL